MTLPLQSGCSGRCIAACFSRYYRYVTTEPPPNGNPQRVSFPCCKTVTAKKIEANRKNAECSTGPRTERGKRNVRFNALTVGLFAKHVVIPDCDGDKAEKDFQSLLGQLHQEFQPVGSYEEWLVW